MCFIAINLTKLQLWPVFVLRGKERESLNVFSQWPQHFPAVGPEVLRGLRGPGTSSLKQKSMVATPVELSYASHR